MSVNNWYSNRAHRSDEDPRYDPENDDPRDPFEFGAVREIRSPAGGRRRGGGHAARSTPRAAATPARRAGGGSAARQVKNPRVTPPSKARKQWEEFAKTWFSRNPTGSARACRDAARAAGLLHVTNRWRSSSYTLHTRAGSNQPLPRRRAAWRKRREGSPPTVRNEARAGDPDPTRHRKPSRGRQWSGRRTDARPAIWSPTG